MTLVYDAKTDELLGQLTTIQNVAGYLDWLCILTRDGIYRQVKRSSVRLEKVS